MSEWYHGEVRRLRPGQTFIRDEAPLVRPGSWAHQACVGGLLGRRRAALLAAPGAAAGRAGWMLDAGCAARLLSLQTAPPSFCILPSFRLLPPLSFALPLSLYSTTSWSSSR